VESQSQVIYLGRRGQYPRDPQINFETGSYISGRDKPLSKTCLGFIILDPTDMFHIRLLKNISSSTCSV